MIAETVLRRTYVRGRVPPGAVPAGRRVREGHREAAEVHGARVAGRRVPGAVAADLNVAPDPAI